MTERPTMVRLTTAQRKAMQAFADADDRSLSYMIRKAVDRFIQADQRKADYE